MSPPSRSGRRPENRPPPRRRSGQRRRASRRGKGRAVPLIVSIPIALAFLVAALGFGGSEVFKRTCSLNSLRPVKIGQNSFVYAADGTLLGSIPAERNRQPVPLDKVSPWVSKATVAIEDRRFWHHGGIDYEAIARAAWRDLQEWRIVEGGSTITQQLVRNLYIGRDRTFGRKLKEVCLAMKLGDSWPKRRILRTYM
nr:transglycosylase domain-containing protein [Actinomycetota bacterium]